jgi:hypothetical protein
VNLTLHVQKRSQTMQRHKRRGRAIDMRIKRLTPAIIKRLASHIGPTRQDGPLEWHEMELAIFYLKGMRTEPYRTWRFQLQQMMRAKSKGRASVP